jgi:hypothetical protein
MNKRRRDAMHRVSRRVECQAIIKMRNMYDTKTRCITSLQEKYIPTTPRRDASRLYKKNIFNEKTITP